jgi:hypothetical protein
MKIIGLTIEEIKRMHYYHRLVPSASQIMSPFRKETGEKKRKEKKT